MCRLADTTVGKYSRAQFQCPMMLDGAHFLHRPDNPDPSMFKSRDCLTALPEGQFYAFAYCSGTVDANLLIA
jgi:hypothetical protein